MIQLGGKLAKCIRWNKHLLFDGRCVHPIQLNWRFASKNGLEMVGDCKATWWCWRRLQRSLRGWKASSSLPKPLSGQEVTCSAIPLRPLPRCPLLPWLVRGQSHTLSTSGLSVHYNIKALCLRGPSRNCLNKATSFRSFESFAKVVQLRTWQVMVFNFIPGCQSIADLCRDFERTHPCGRSLGNGDLSCLSKDRAHNNS